MGWRHGFGQSRLQAYRDEEVEELQNEVHMLKKVAECNDLVSHVPKLFDYGKDPRVQLSLVLPCTFWHLPHEVVDAQCSCLEEHNSLALDKIATILAQNNGCSAWEVSSLLGTCFRSVGILPVNSNIRYLEPVR